MNVKHSSSCYNVTSVVSVKVCNSFVSCQSVCKVDPIHSDAAHVTTVLITKHWNEICLFPCQLRMLQMSVNNKYGEVDCLHAISFDVPTTLDTDTVDILKI